MDLFLLRHGAAEPSAARDKERRLTADGRDEIHRVMAHNSVKLASVNRVLVSPYVRAQQTCELALEYLPHIRVDCVMTVDFLVPGANPQKSLDWLSDQAADFHTLFVSHQPLVGTLLDDLCGFEAGRYRMSTACLAALHLPMVGRGLADLRWFSCPRDLVD